MKKYTIIVIGAGSGGLVIAIGAAKARRRVLLIEKGTYGGDCTNFGCIPSKSLIASAHVAQAIKKAKHYGIESNPSLTANKALERAEQIVCSIRTHEEPEALKKLGVETLTGTAQFRSSHLVEVTDQEGKCHLIKGKKIVIATGSSPLIPSIPGLEKTPFLTNETVFSLKEIPKTFAILGGGPIGCELAQTFSRLGATVHLIHRHPAPLTKEEPRVQALIAKQLQKEGIALYLNSTLFSISHVDETFHLIVENLENCDKKEIQADAFLVATGRTPNISSLGLDAAQVRHSKTGIPIDRFGRTNKKHIFALGDVTGAPFFTHKAENHARSILPSLLLPWPFLKALSDQPIPRTTFTDPEIASVGLSTKEAQQLYPTSSIAIYSVPFAQVDRAITEGREEGYLTIVTKKWSSKILGTTIVGPRAGEMLAQITTAMACNIPLRRLAKIIYPYPTYNHAVRKAADQWLTQTILGSLKKR